MRKLLALSFVFALALPLSTVVIAQNAPTPEAPTAEKTKRARWEGTIIRSNPDTSTLTVRNAEGAEMAIQYDSSTRWVSQEHGSKKVNDIDAKQVQDGDRVICRGSWEKKGVLHATLISKRLSNP
jgi:hypothetical protein